MNRLRLLLAAVGFGFLLSGCATPIVFIPDDIAHQGLLVGKVVTPDMPDLLEGDPVIDGRKFSGGMRSGYVVVPLDPGEYNLESINVRTGSRTISTPYSTHTTVYSTSYPIGRSFTIERGRATNVGLLVFMAGAKGSSRYYMFALDNSKEMATFLRETHPALQASLKDAALDAPGPFLDPAKTSQLRRVIAITMLARHKHRYVGTTLGYVGGPAGTLVRIKRDSTGKAVDLVVLDTGTAVDLTECSVSSDRAACMLSSSEFLLAKGESVTTMKVPEGVIGNSIHVYEGGLALVDSSMNIYNSGDDGRSWTKYDGVAWAEPLGYDWTRPDQKNRFSFVSGKRGFYLYSPTIESDKAPLLYYDYALRSYRNLSLPDSADRVKSVYETDAGLFVGPSYTAFANGKVHLLPAGGGAWQVRETPEAACKDFAVIDGSGREIQILCKKENVWKSTDGGLNWQRIFKNDSLFQGEH